MPNSKLHTLVKTPSTEVQGTQFSILYKQVHCPSNVSELVYIAHYKSTNFMFI